VRIHVLSDLHFEHRSPIPAPVDADVIVLGGDIALGTQGLEWAKDWSRGRPTLYVCGNHEFYGHSMPGLIEELRASAEGSSVHFLEDDEVLLGGVRFLGATLWSDFDFDGAEHRQRSMSFCESVVNDYRQIRFDPENRPLRPQDTREIHLRSRAWLESKLDQPHNGPTVVLSHHAPLLPPPEIVLSQAARAVAGAFASDLSPLMGARRVDLWLFGHTHRAVDREIEGTRVFSNPCGYPNEPVAGYDPACVIELDRAG
jgi:predicted phosphodiesterase